VAHYDVFDPGEALNLHVHELFEGHEIALRRWPLGPIEQRIPAFQIFAIGPGPRFGGWSYLTSGCWKATAQHQHGLEFILSTNGDDMRHLEVLTVLAYFHAGPESQRLDLGHTTTIGESWMPGSRCDSMLIALPYAYGADLETCAWNTGHARILTALPITSAERDLKINQSVEALEQRLEDAGADFSNPMRSSTV